MCINISEMFEIIGIGFVNFFHTDNDVIDN